MSEKKIESFKFGLKDLDSFPGKNKIDEIFERIAKDIKEREDEVMAKEFTQIIGKLLRENGVVPHIVKIENMECTPYSVEKHYGVSIDELDFTEHDKVFEDKIAKLEKQIKSYEAERKELRTRCCMDSAREKFDNHSYGGLVIYTKNFTSECERRLYEENKELKQRIVELESKEMEKPTKLNLNDRVKVKLTPLGAEIYYHQCDDVNKKIKENGGTELEPIMPQIDKDGYTEFQLWHFIELYGKHIGMCKPNVIEPLDIVIVE